MRNPVNNRQVNWARDRLGLGLHDILYKTHQRQCYIISRLCIKNRPHSLPFRQVKLRFGKGVCGWVGGYGSWCKFRLSVYYIWRVNMSNISWKFNVWPASSSTMIFPAILKMHSAHSSAVPARVRQIYFNTRKLSRIVGISTFDTIIHQGTPGVQGSWQNYLKTFELYMQMTATSIRTLHNHPSVCCNIIQ